MSDDYSQVIDQLIPKEGPPSINKHKALEENYYYKWALYDSIRLKNSELALAVWNSIPTKFKKNSDS